MSAHTHPPAWYIVCDMSDEGLELLGLGDLVARRRAMMAELVAHRRAAALSQEAVADRMGTSQPAIARLEAGEVDARLSTVERYAAAVGRSLELRLGPARSVLDGSSRPDGGEATG